MYYDKFRLGTADVLNKCEIFKSLQKNSGTKKIDKNDKIIKSYEKKPYDQT